MLRAHVATGGYAAVVASGAGTAHRVVEQLAQSDTPGNDVGAGRETRPPAKASNSNTPIGPFQKTVRASASAAANALADSGPMSSLF